jgi:hypothetical protein
VELNLYPCSGGAYTKHLRPNWILVQHSILKLMGKLK